MASPIETAKSVPGAVTGRGRTDSSTAWLWSVEGVGDRARAGREAGGKTDTGDTRVDRLAAREPDIVTVGRKKMSVGVTLREAGDMGLPTTFLRPRAMVSPNAGAS